MMKKLLIALIFIGGMGWAHAQAYPIFDRNQELKFNIGNFLANSALGVTYEYFISEDASLGGGMYFDDTPGDRNGSFGIGPNLRAYFGYAPRSGFFAEAFGLYYTGERQTKSSDVSARHLDYSTTALGLGVGNKWVTRSDRFSMEVHFRLGRNLYTNVSQNTLMYRSGLSLGFRF